MIDEIVINHALQGIKTGLSKAEVRTDVAQNTNLRKTTIDELLAKALTEAEAQGVERQDIHDTWYGWKFTHEASIAPDGEYTNCPRCTESGEHTPGCTAWTGR